MILEPVERPAGAHCFLNGQHYKVGRFNRVFVHRNGEWVFTNGITVDQIGREIQKQEIEEVAKRSRKKKGYVL